MRRICSAKASSPVMVVGAVACALALSACTAVTKGSAAHVAAVTTGGMSAAADAAQPAPSPAASAAAPAAAGAAAGTGDAPVLANRDVIYTADITVRTTDIKKAVTAVEGLVPPEGVVYGEQVDLTAKDPLNPGNASATVTLKVLPKDLQRTLNAVSTVGTEVSRSENSDDVTSKVVDVKARIGAAQTSIARLSDLLAHTGSVAHLLNVENQLAQRESDLESLESQQKSLEAQSSDATITVHLVAMPPVAAPAPKPRTAHVLGFIRGLRGGWHAFATAAAAVATAFGALLPFLVVMLVVVAALFAGRRKLRRRRPQES